MAGIGWWFLALVSFGLFRCNCGHGVGKGDAGCAQVCVGIACGASDGCGGICQPGSGCCVPVCSGVECGAADGCGGTCPPGSGCTAGCVPPNPPDAGWGSRDAPLGKPCSLGALCGAGFQCTDVAAGYCYRDCTLDGQCPGDGVCLGVGGLTAWCFASCSLQGTSSGCPVGTACNPYTADPFDRGICFPSCVVASDCNATTVTHFRCVKGACFCASDVDCNGEPTGIYKCGANGGCFAPCTADSTCATSGAGGCCLASGPNQNQCETFTQPVANCTTLGCIGGDQCQPVAGSPTCVATAPDGCTVAIEPVNLGTADTVASTSTTAVINQPAAFTFPVSGGAAGWTVVAQSPGTGVGVTRIVDPSGAVLWDWNNPWPASAVPGQPAFAPSLFTGTLTYTFPNTAPADGGMPAVLPGTWSVSLGTTAITALTVEVLQKSALGATGRKVDADFWVVSATHTASDLTTGASAPQWSNVIAGIDSAWGPAGIQLGTVTVRDVSSALKTQYATVDGNLTSACTGIQKLFQDAAAGAGVPLTQTGLNFFLVDTITGGGGSTILGIDGSIPGPGGVNGTPASGAVAVLDLGSALYMAHILAHEGGHYLGLFHTTETDGTEYDPVADTPACPTNTMLGNSAACPDSTYLMFPYVNAASPGQMTVSAEQSAIVRVAPSVY